VATAQVRGSPGPRRPGHADQQFDAFPVVLSVLPNRPGLRPGDHGAIKAKWSLDDLRSRPSALDHRADLRPEPGGGRIDQQFGAFPGRFCPFPRRRIDHARQNRLRWRRAPIWAGLWPARASAQRGRRGSRVKGREAIAKRRGAPLSREGRPRTLRGATGRLAAQRSDRDPRRTRFWLAHPVSAYAARRPVAWADDWCVSSEGVRGLARVHPFAAHPCQWRSPSTGASASSGCGADSEHVNLRPSTGRAAAACTACRWGRGAAARRSRCCAAA
jgi:hypothetical protein